MKFVQWNAIIMHTRSDPGLGLRLPNHVVTKKLSPNHQLAVSSINDPAWKHLFNLPSMKFRQFDRKRLKLLESNGIQHGRRCHRTVHNNLHNTFPPLKHPDAQCTDFFYNSFAYGWCWRCRQDQTQPHFQDTFHTGNCGHVSA